MTKPHGNCAGVSSRIARVRSSTDHKLRRFSYQNAHTLLFLSIVAIIFLITGVIRAVI